MVGDHGRRGEPPDEALQDFDSAVATGTRFFEWVLQRDRLIERVLRLASERGLVEDEVRMLVAIGRQQHEDSDEPTGTSLAAELEISQPLASQHLVRLRDMGLVESHPGLFDRRSQVARLTLAGKRMLVALFAQRRS